MEQNYSRDMEAYTAFLRGGVSLTELLMSSAPAPALVSAEEEAERPWKRGRTATAMAVPRGSLLARGRRQRLCEKMRCLQRVVPWDKKMDMTTMLEETYKYVKFLQAQLSALNAMPVRHHSGSNYSAVQRSFPGALERLSPSQLLQVLVNSPVVQTLLYSKGFCVFSLHHLPLLTSDCLLPFPF